MKVAIVGAGLFGSLISARLQQVGHEVTVFDDDRPGAGSRPAACLMKPSWLSSIPKPELKEVLKWLDSTYQLYTIPFKLPLGTADVYWVDPRRVLQIPRKNARVDWVRLNPYTKFYDLCLETPRTITAFDAVVLACGIWANELLPPHMRVEGLRGLAGAAFEFPGQIEQPFIHPWAPYKQVVAFNRTDTHIWVGDGSSIKRENWSTKRELESLVRCSNHLGRSAHEANILYGVRPYVSNTRGMPCLLEEPTRRLFVATGGAKNGTAAGAWAALRIAERLE